MTPGRSGRAVGGAGGAHCGVVMAPDRPRSASVMRLTRNNPHWPSRPVVLDSSDMRTLAIAFVFAAAGAIALVYLADHLRRERARNEQARSALAPRGTVRAKRPSHHRWTHWP